MGMKELTERQKKQMLIEHEGFRLDPYKDKLGYLTGGMGHKMSKEDIKSFDPNWSKEKKIGFWVHHFEKDYAKAGRHAVKHMVNYGIPADNKTQFVLTSMMFQLGPTGGHFKNMFKALANGDKEAAIKEMYTDSKGGGPSKWYKQTPNRVDALAELLES